MQVKSYRGKTLHEALELVRQELGPDASVLGTREVRGHWIKGLFGVKQVEVVASREVHVPSRFVGRTLSHSVAVDVEGTGPAASNSNSVIPAADEESYRHKFRSDLAAHGSQSTSAIGELCGQTRSLRSADLPESLFRLFAELMDAEIREDLAQQMVDTVRASCTAAELEDLAIVKQRLFQMVHKQIRVKGPIQVTPGTRRLVALVGPTGVGKTTTIAKLAANFRLKEKRRVGLITVDTYRIAAVEQLRTYADIIDLPMEVVSTPREMREAVNRLAHLDLILMDTAGRSPHDEVKIQELKCMLAEAEADEVQLVLSVIAGAAALTKLAKHFAPVGTTSLLLTKLDEATGLGTLLPLLQTSELPLSYVTNGQNVPDDIHAASAAPLAKAVLGMEQ